MARLVFASLVTFGILIGMVAGCVLAPMVLAGEVNLAVAIALTVAINLFIWLVSPWLSDLTLRWFNKLEFLDDAAVKQRYPGVHQLRGNARIVVTQGIFEFLSERSSAPWSRTNLAISSIATSS